MRISNYTEMEWDESKQRYVTTFADWYEYDGPVALCGSGGGSAPAQPAETTTTQISAPPEYVEPYAKRYMTRAENLSKRPYEPYPFSTVAELAPEQIAGLNMTSNLAINGDPGVNAAKDTWAQTASGQFLNSNPYVDAMYGKAATAMGEQYSSYTKPGTDAAATMAGALGNTGYQEYGDAQRYDFGENLGNLATDIYGNNYANERTHQMNAVGMTPQFNAMNYGDAQALVGVGDVYRDVDQANINQDYKDFETNRLWDYSNLDVLGNAIGVGAGTGGSTITTAPSFYESNPYAGAIGGGALGYGASQLGSGFNPYLGAGAGALGGYLLS